MTFDGVELFLALSGRGSIGVCVLWRVRIWTLDLNEAFGTDRLIAASGSVQVWGIIQEADGAFAGIFV